MSIALMRLTTGIVYARSISGTLTFASGGVLALADGTAAAPSLTQASDPDNGLSFGTNQLVFSTAGTARWQIRATGDFFAAADNEYSIGTSDAARPKDIYVAGRYYQGGSGSATSTSKLVKKVTGIADNTATAVLTVTVPNANHAASIDITILSSNGSTDAFESSRTARGAVVLARTTGVTTVATAATLTLTGIATVAAGATHTLAYSLSAMTGAAGAQQTFTINVTIDDSGNLGSNQVVVLAEIINAEATGITIA